MTGLNPFELQAFEFLVLYAMLFAAAVGAGFAIVALLRPEGNAPVVSKDDELALLAGGRNRLGETVLARMLAAGQARIQKASDEISKSAVRAVETVLAKARPSRLSKPWAAIC